MQATVRDAGVSHIALCADCTANLASARTVSSGLVLAASAESEAAPVRIKENLMAAFKVLQETGSGGIETAAAPLVNSVVDISSGRRLRWWTAAAVALAAVILLAVVLPNWRTGSGPASSPLLNDFRAGRIEQPPPPDTTIDRTGSNADNDQPGIAPKSAAVKRRPLKLRRPEAGDPKAAYETVPQNTNEYMPLTYLAKSTAIDSGTIVRVELSRSALASLGLPINLEGKGSIVKAEVVIGDDGVAQAIRLVE
ncbi:MAG TPA: hypothetical protein VMS31_18210 [Pyrinomonadaceae bacterium]|nr:hypothetical protein [Pyrinomonadaceae bacterium]